jgi:hypothetical protein
MGYLEEVNHVPVGIKVKKISLEIGKSSYKYVITHPSPRFIQILGRGRKSSENRGTQGKPPANSCSPIVLNSNVRR